MTTKIDYLVTLSGRLVLDGQVVTAYQTVADTISKVMNEFDKLGTSSPGVFFSAGRIQVHCSVRAQLLEDAPREAGPTIRAALHAAGISTPDFPSGDSAAWSVADLDVRASSLVTA